MSHRLLAGCAAAIVIGLAPAVAHAERCGDPIPWISVQFEGEAWLVEAGPEMLLDLRAGLHPRGIAVCGVSDQQSGEPGARVRLVTTEHQVRVEIGSENAPLESVRELAIEALPTSGRSVMLSATIEESLRSIWERLQRPEMPLGEDGTIEPQCEDSPQCGSSVPDGCPAAPPCQPEEPREPGPPLESLGLGLAVGAALDVSNTGAVWLGATLGARVRLHAHVQLGLGIGGALSLPQGTSEGTVTGQRLLPYVQIALSPMSDRQSIRLFGVVSAKLPILFLHGDTDATELGMLVGAGAELAWAATSGLDLLASALFEWHVREVHLSDGANRLGSLGLYGVAATVGAVFWF